MSCHAEVLTFEPVKRMFVQACHIKAFSSCVVFTGVYSIFAVFYTIYTCIDSLQN